jgi:signal transduction histidine kinase
MRVSPLRDFLDLANSSDNDKLEMIQRFNSRRPPGGPLLLDLTDRDGRSRISGSQVFAPENLPPGTVIESAVDPIPVRFGRNEGPPPMFLVRDQKDPENFIVAKFANPRPPGSLRARGGPMLSVAFPILIAVVLASGLSLFLLFSFFRDRGNEAEAVIRELQRGNLKARFPITKMDEAGQLMLSFNKMASEIENLVEGLRKSERTRIELLQELAHDLRTPVASLKNLLETLFLEKSLSAETQAELSDLSLKEVDYFQRLVDDLLFLARIIEPRYKTETAQLNILEVLTEQVRAVNSQYPQLQISISGNVEEAAVPPILGDKNLLRRMLRNVLENSGSFAKSQLQIYYEVREQGGAGPVLSLEFRDDGPGFSTEALASYGKKKASRVLESNGTGRVSVGLGSVIIVALAKIHRAEVQVRNLSPTTGGVRGAVVALVFSSIHKASK